MPDTIVVQWSRLGDILQTRPLLRDLRKADPNGHLWVSADTRYGDLLSRMPERPEFHPVNLSDLSGTARHKTSHPEFLRKINETIGGLPDRDFDLVIVLSRSRSAALFGKLLHGKKEFGYSLSDVGIRVPDQFKWIEERMAARQPVPVHISDVWRSLTYKMMESEWLPPLMYHENQKGITGVEGSIVALLCDAGESYREIPSHWLTELAVHILDVTDNTVLLLGQKPDKTNRFAGLVSQHGDRVLDMRGRTSLSTLMDYLASTRIVIGPDTGGLHLAAAMGIPVIGLYFGGATAGHTGPLSPWAYVIQDPQWTEAEMDVIARRTSASASDEPASQSGSNPMVFGSTIDKYGVAYVSPSADTLLAPEADERRRFFELFARSENAEQGMMTPPAQLQDLSIVIPESGVEYYTDELLSDLESACGSKAEVILVCSGDSHARTVNRTILRLRVIRSAQPLTFAEACNTGAQSATCKWLLFLNNDTRITSSVVTTLLRDAKETEIQSPLIRYPDGLIQNAGVLLEANRITEVAHGQRLYRGMNELTAVSAVAMLMTKSVWQRLQGFDTAYRNGYEDIDLCLRAKAHGIKSRVNPQSEIVHYRGSTLGRHDTERENVRIFANRWHQQLQATENRGSSNSKMLAARLVIVSDESIDAAGSCLRWRWPLEACGLVANRDYTWIRLRDHQRDVNGVAKIVGNAQKVVVFRPLSDHRIQAMLLESVTKRRASLHVDCDDLFFGRFHGVTRRGERWQELEGDWRALLNVANTVTVSNEAIQANLADNGFHAMIMPTHPDKRLHASEEQTSHDSNTVRIGFFGTPSHLIDLGSVIPALERVLEICPQVRFFWWGCRPGELTHHPQVRQGGPVVDNYEDHLYRLHQMNLDVVVVPLLESPYANAKSPIKYYEYALAGIPGVYSNTAPYTSRIKHGITGMLASDSTTDWISHLRKLIEDASFRQFIRANAMDDVSRILHMRRTYSELTSVIGDVSRSNRAVSDDRELERCHR